MKTRKRKIKSHPRLEKPQKKDRAAERTLKTKSLADFIDRKTEESNENEFETFAQEDLICPFCGFSHDAEDLNIKKQQDGLVKCADCGEAFEYEVVVLKAYTTFVP